MKKLVLVAWASADWRLIRPLLNAGRMPHLARLIARGAHGNLATLQPQSSPMQWTSLATGLRADAHGILAPILAGGDGAHPASGVDRRSAALWSMIERRGGRANVVNWPYSHPAEPLDGAMLSELYAWVLATPEAPGAQLPWAEGSVAAQGLEDDLADMRVHAAEPDLDMLSWFVPAAREVDPAQEDLLAHVAAALARGLTTHAAATLLIEESPASLNVVCYDALTVLGARFMALLPPQLPYMPAELVERYGGVVPRMLEYLDLQLGRLVELAGEDANIMLVSDHGMRSDHLRPQTIELALQRLAAPWVRDQGIFVAAGPEFREGVQIEGAGLLDIAPTVLALLDLPVGKDMPGRPLMHALTDRRAPAHIGTWGAADRDRGAQLTEAGARALLETRVALGEIGPQVLEDDRLADTDFCAGVEADARFNLAMVFMESRRQAQALPILRGLHEAAPDDERITLHLARCLQANGDLEAARALMQGVAEAGPPRPHEHLMLSRMYRQQGEPAKALASLFRAEQANPGQPGLHCRIGEVYLQMKRWPDATRAFDKALALDADHAAAHHGMAIVHLAEGRNEDAVEAALTAVGLAHQSPQAHFHLGIALSRIGRPVEAIQAFETSLAQQRDNLAAHQWLAELYRDVIHDADKERHHLSCAARLQVSALMRQS